MGDSEAGRSGWGLGRTLKDREDLGLNQGLLGIEDIDTGKAEGWETPDSGVCISGRI